MSKRIIEARKLVDPAKTYTVKEAVQLMKKAPAPKFDETIDLAFSFDVDPKQSDQLVRGTILLPHGTGRKVRVLVFAKGDAERAAKEAGAEFVGAEEFFTKVEHGWMDFDAVVSTPDLMREVGKLGKVLGPRGLMPSPKSGTVTNDVGRAVSDLKKGKVEFKMDKQGDIHLGVGKLSFSPEALEDNITTLLEAIWKAKPASAKGRYLKSAVVSSTMGPGFKLEASAGKKETE